MCTRLWDYETEVLKRREMDAEKLNEELAEWAGWHWERYEIASGVFSRVLLAPDERLEEGHIGYIPDHTPNFTESLDACFKWLVPELSKLGWFISLSMLQYELVWSAELYQPDPKDISDKWMDAKVETPALAFCLAIEKLIDDKK